jgi:hypothetical protein
MPFNAAAALEIIPANYLILPSSSVTCALDVANFACFIVPGPMKAAVSGTV